ncbi:MAG TPA: CAP domain-containing protein [Acidimicrobiales bacterium]
MSAPRRHPRSLGHFAVASIVALGVMSIGVSPAGADPGGQAVVVAEPSDDSYMVNRINELRASKGLGSLSVDSHLFDVALNWTNQMAADDQLYHNPNLASDVNERDWVKLGENVGRTTGTVQDVQKAFEESPGHYANLVDPDFTHVGIASRRVDGTLWVTQVFMKPANATTPPTSAPTTQPPTTEAPPPATPPPSQPPATSPATVAPPPAPAPAELEPIGGRGRGIRLFLLGMRRLEQG